MKNENSNIAIVLNERTYAYTHGIYKAVCFIFFESTVIAPGYFLLSFLIISRVHETAHTRSRIIIRAIVDIRTIHGTDLLDRLIHPVYARTHTYVYVYIKFVLHIIIYVRVRRKCTL